MPPRKPKSISIRITVLGVFLIVAASTAGLALGLQYYFSRNLARTAAETAFRTTSDKIGERIRALDRHSANLVEMLGNFYELATFPGPEQEERSLPLLCSAMENNPSLYAIYVGYGTGDFFEVINLESSPRTRHSLEAAPHDRWVVIRIQGAGESRKKTAAYLDASLRVRVRREEAGTYDPRNRPWFIKAAAATGMTKTAPYIFTHLKAPGVTYAKSIKNGQRVVAVDISLDGLSTFLDRQRFMNHSQAFVFNRKGDILARASRQEAGKETAPGPSISLTPAERAFVAATPVIRASNETDWPPFDFAMSGSPRGYSVDMLNLAAGKAGLKVTYVNGYSWQGLVGLFRKGELDLLHSLLKTPEREKMGVFTGRYIPMPQAWAVREDAPFPAAVSELEGKTVAIPEGWATDTYLAKNHPGIRRLHVPTTLDAMRAVLSGVADATLDSRPVLRYLKSSYFMDKIKLGGQVAELDAGQGLHFLVRPEKAVLAAILDKALAAVTPAEKAALDAKWFEGDAGVQAPEDRGTIPHPEILAMASTAGAAGDLRRMEINGRAYFGYVARVESVYGSGEFLGMLVPLREIMRPYMAMVRFSLLVTMGLMVLLAPVVWYCATVIVHPINALALESLKVKARRYEEVGSVKSNITEIQGLSRSLVDMASSIKAYEESLKELMDAFIRLIATAIDHKSPYTGGHCARVPELSVMLAREADACTRGPLADFSLKNDEEWHEFRTAAWLHDCGKVATPEYIVDKSTKLETIYNRIHEVRMRFEVLLRDAEISFLKEMARGGDPEALQEELAARQREIREDFDFVAQCNLGGEFMAEEQVLRLRKIAENTWVRHLDDRKGLGHLELMRYPETAPDLPCPEPLLADRAEHIIPRQENALWGSADSRFPLDMPEHLYNLGEIYNLSISRGTLTAEDRYIINEHIVTTIRMLEMLPYPEHMTRIPEFAGAHHETLIGTGYPRKLAGKDIGIPARIMALADVFEALTASDRPYKKAKPLSEAIRILSFMVKDQHLDADLFRLFLESGVYLEYAKKFLDPSQIDAVDVLEFLPAE